MWGQPTVPPLRIGLSVCWWVGTLDPTVSLLVWPDLSHLPHLQSPETTALTHSRITMDLPSTLICLLVMGFNYKLITFCLCFRKRVRKEIKVKSAIHLLVAFQVHLPENAVPLWSLLCQPTGFSVLGHKPANRRRYPKENITSINVELPRFWQGWDSCDLQVL